MTDTDFVGQISRAVSAVHITSLVGFTWLGAASPALDPKAARAMSPEIQRGCLRFLLRQQLYENFYLRGRAMPASRVGHNGGKTLQTPFIEALSAANAGTGSWQDGWTVRAVHEDGVVAHNGALAIFAPAGECRPVGAHGLVPGAAVRLRFPKEARRISPGFYMAEGDLVPEGDGGIVRLYWHLRPRGATILMREITTRLNAAGFPFRCKVLHDPAAYGRCDAGVLYLRRRDFAAAAGPLVEIYGVVAEHLDPETPALTKPLAPGLGLAEDPGEGESFGMHRCALLAEGLIQAHEQGKETPEDRLATVVRTLAEAGIDPERPYLAPGSHDVYEWSLPMSEARRSSRPDQPDSPLPLLQGAFLEAAARIGARLAREAIWSGDRCTWVTTDLVPRAVDGQSVAITRPLGPDLYAGASGVAFFLADLAAYVDDAAIRRTALGAIRQALARVDEIPPTLRAGLYTGWTGVACAAVHVGARLGAPDVMEAGVALSKRALAGPLDDRMTDLLAGRAGAIVGALALADDEHLDRARALGDDLLRLARTHRDGSSWTGHISHGTADLTGFSHGAAGIGYALLELFAATDDERYRDGASRAFAWERQWFDAEAGNWADLRGMPRRTKPGSPNLPSMVAWCHGAPGIALARLRAWQLLADEATLAEASIALETTSRAVASEVNQPGGDVTLCHGLLGLADILAIGGQMTGDEGLVDLARQTGARCLAAFGDGRRPWPCGGHTGELPGLMLGLAGIGHAFLRLHDPAVPSALLPGQAWVSRASANPQDADTARSVEDVLVLV